MALRMQHGDRNLATHCPMIHLTRLNHIPLVVNSDLIEHVEVTPDTVVVLTTGQKILVLESAEEIVERIVQFRRRLSCDTVAPATADRAPERGT
jgi:flagellar protein FlbD